MNLIFASDNNGVDMTATAIYSVIKNNQKHELTFYIIHSNITTGNQARLNKLAEKFDNTTIEFIVAEEKHFENIAVTNNKVTMEAYYRYLAPEVLPASEKRALSMDIDMLCLGDLAELYETDLEGNCIAAVEDWVIMHGKQYDNFRRWFLTNNKNKYINSGLMLLNLDKMRDGVMNTFWENIYNRSALIPKEFDIFADQTITNITFNEKVTYLDKKYNVFTTALKQLGVKRPIIVHFTGSHKPLTYKDEYSIVYDNEYHNYYYDCINIIGGSVAVLHRKAAQVLVRDAVMDATYDINISKNKELINKEQEIANKNKELINKEQEIAALHRQQRDVRFLAKRLAAETQTRLNKRAKGMVTMEHLRYRESTAVNELLQNTNKDDILATVHKLDTRNIKRSRITTAERLKPIGWRAAAGALNTSVRITKKVRHGK